MQKNDVRQLLESKLTDVVKEIPNAAIVANFPNYFVHSFALNYTLGREEFGFQITRMNTAGKIAYSDYSGKYVNKLTLTGVRIGTRYRYHLKDFSIAKKHKVTLFGELSPGVVVSKLKHEVYEQYGDETVNEDNDDDYGTTQFSLLPQVGAKVNFGRLGVHVIAGYDFQFGGKLDNDLKTKISWIGLRTGIGVSYTFPPKKEKTKPKKQTK
jgi:hypothetical protein